MIIFCALAAGRSRIRIGPITKHTETAIEVAKMITGVTNYYPLLALVLLFLLCTLIHSFVHSFRFVYLSLWVRLLSTLPGRNWKKGNTNKRRVIFSNAKEYPLFLPTSILIPDVYNTGCSLLFLASLSQ